MSWSVDFDVSLGEYRTHEWGRVNCDTQLSCAELAVYRYIWAAQYQSDTSPRWKIVVSWLNPWSSSVASHQITTDSFQLIWMEGSAYLLFVFFVFLLYVIDALPHNLSYTSYYVVLFAFCIIYVAFYVICFIGSVFSGWIFLYRPLWQKTLKFLKELVSLGH